MFYHSALSDWNHGNAHFLRGIATELVSRGHGVTIYERNDAWSLLNLQKEHGSAPIRQFHATYPELTVVQYDPRTFSLQNALDSADLVIVHEWNDPTLVASIGRHRLQHGNYSLFFHDTHHRSVTAPQEMSAFDLSGYDGILAYGASIREVYLRNRWATNVWVWHEAADTRVFYPMRPDSGLSGGNRNEKAHANGNGNGKRPFEGDLVWIGNWGDGERASEIREFLIEPVRELGLKARVYGVRYPADAVQALSEAGIEYAGWLPNFEVPRIFSKYRVTVHIPRRPYVRVLPGIPTIRPFEALACAIPLICANWSDAESLFTPGRDYLVADSSAQMKRHLQTLLSDPPYAQQVAKHGHQTILQRHTCRHRVDSLLSIYRRTQLSLQGALT